MAAISSAPQQRAASASGIRPRRRTWRMVLTMLLVLCDALGVNGAFVGAFTQGYQDYIEPFYSPRSDDTLLLFLLLFNIVCGVIFTTSGLYTLRRGASRVDEAYKVFTAVSLVTLSTFLVNVILLRFEFQDVPLPTTILAFGWLAAIFSVIILRLAHRRLVYGLRQRGIDTRRVLIVGARAPGREVWRTIRRSPELGYMVQGFLSDTVEVGDLVDGMPVLGRTEHLERVVRATQADEVILALSGRSPAELVDLVAQVENETINIKVYPDTFQLITNNEISVGDLSGLPLVSVKNVALDNPLNRVLKRGFDITFSCILLVCISPLMLLLALLIKLDSTGPVFWPQQRVGLDGRRFFCIKFRSMRVDAESSGPGWTTPNDPRVTRIGRFLRHHSLDELPQFINVLLGDMSVVGPRPEQPVWVEQFSQQIPRYARRHREKVGVTGWAQVNGLRGDTSIEERTRYDVYYLENWSLLFDIKIIVRTAVDMLTGKQENAY